MTSLGLKLLVFNRTPSKAQEVADRFGGKVLLELTPEAILEATGGQGKGQEYIDVVVSTIPAAAEFVLPGFLLKEKPVVMDVAYRPAETSLLAQARQEGCPFVQVCMCSICSYLCISLSLSLSRSLSLSLSVCHQNDIFNQHTHTHTHTHTGSGDADWARDGAVSVVDQETGAGGGDEEGGLCNSGRVEIDMKMKMRRGV